MVIVMHVAISHAFSVSDRLILTFIVLLDADEVFDNFDHSLLDTLFIINILFVPN